MLAPIVELSRHFLASYAKPYRRYFLQRNSLNHRFAIIVGERGVGKSTAMVQHLLDTVGGNIGSDEILFVQADHIAFRNHTLYEIAETFRNRGGKTICFDEIHKYPDWSMELKSIYDTFTDLRIVASGSSALKIQRGSHDLSRRAVVYRMAGLSFREYVELTTGLSFPARGLDALLSDPVGATEEILAALAPSGKKILSLFNDHLRRGVYPFFLEFPDVEVFRRVVEQNLRATIESDIPASYPTMTGETVRKLERLLAYVASAVPLIPDMTRLQGILELGDARTLKTYLAYLGDAGIIMQLPRAGKTMGPLEKPGKIYLGNSCQAHAVTMEEPHIGTIRETFLASVLRPHHTVSIPKKGDFLVDGKWLFEVGGKSKDFRQISGEKNSFLAVDDIERGAGARIPLWLFGWEY